MNKVQKQIQNIAKWVNSYVTSYKLNGVTLGISGGIDSAVVAGIISKFTNLETQYVFMDIGNSTLDKKCVKELAKKLKVNIRTIDLKKEFQTFIKTIKVKDKMTLANIKPRLRMTTLFALASEKKHIVLGTSNADELYLGYFTKFGDSGCDLMPIANLNKSEIFEIAKELELPKSIIERAPSAGLFNDQTDEKEMGVTYKEIDAYLSGKKISLKSKQTIERLHKVNFHKFSMPLKPKGK